MKQRQWKPRSKFRRVLRRSSVVWWAAALVLGATTTSMMTANISRATRAADGWGSSRQVWVVRHHVAAGTVIGVDDMSLARRPKRLVPVGALDAGRSPVGQAARVELSVGEVVLRDRLSRSGAVGVAAMVDNGRRAIAMKNDESMPSLHAGDRVDILATFDVGDSVEEAPSTAPSFAVATNASVLAVSSRTITLSVTTREAPRLAFALARAAVTVSLRGD